MAVNQDVDEKPAKASDRGHHLTDVFFLRYLSIEKAPLVFLPWISCCTERRWFWYDTNSRVMTTDFEFSES